MKSGGRRLVPLRAIEPQSTLPQAIRVLNDSMLTDLRQAYAHHPARILDDLLSRNRILMNSYKRKYTD